MCWCCGPYRYLAVHLYKIRHAFNIYTDPIDDFFLWAWMSSWTNRRVAVDLKRHDAHGATDKLFKAHTKSHSLFSNTESYIKTIYDLQNRNPARGLETSHASPFIVRRAGLLWSQQDFEWRWSVPLFKCLTVLEFSFILFDLCLLITFFNFIMNYVPIVTFWIFTYHKIWILSIMSCFIWSHWIIYFLACLEVSWRVVS